ncbi:hypothetical protein [Massilia sp.]|uniref:hypothetical protein n=1 Tax=Massilia sp. TaxID=1882437 RepID=UPI00289A5994|nr:hypothetical protein [Massilia sp.]
MTGQLLNLEANQHRSRVLDSWIAGRDGAAERTGVVALGENSSGSLTMSELANLIGAAHRSSSGSQVTAETGMRVSAAYGCMSLVAGAISTLPVGIYERSGNDRDSADHDYWCPPVERSAAADLDAGRNGRPSCCASMPSALRAMQRQCRLGRMRNNQN